MEQIGWYNPASKRFCYLDEKGARPEHFKTYTVKVFVGVEKQIEVQEDCGCWEHHKEIVKGLKIAIDHFFESEAFKECEHCGHIPCGCGG